MIRQAKANRLVFMRYTRKQCQQVVGALPAVISRLLRGYQGRVLSPVCDQFIVGAALDD